MKTIEERAEEYAIRSGGVNSLLIKESFEDGAKSEHEELTRWNSPDCPPEDNREILVKVKNGYNIASYNPDKGYCINSGFYTEILGWREIHE